MFVSDARSSMFDHIWVEYCFAKVVEREKVMKSIFVHMRDHFLLRSIGMMGFYHYIIDQCSCV